MYEGLLSLLSIFDIFEVKSKIKFFLESFSNAELVGINK